MISTPRRPPPTATKTAGVSEWIFLLFLFLSFFFSSSSRASPKNCLQHGWLQRSLEGGGTSIKIRHEPSAKNPMCAVSCPACSCIYVPGLYTYVRVHAPLGTPRRSLRMYGTSERASKRERDSRTCTCVCVCVGAKSGEDLACVSWVVRGISFSRSSA